MSIAQRILDCLAATGPADVATIAQRIGAPVSTVSETTRRLHRNRRVHAVAWQGAQRAVYSVGDGVDAPRPMPRPRSEIHAAYRRDPVVRLDRIMADRARRAIRRKPPPQSWLSCLQ